jgi:hypothetical protein
MSLNGGAYCMTLLRTTPQRLDNRGASFNRRFFTA